MPLPPGRSLELVAQFNPGMTCRSLATTRFALSFGGHAVEYTLVAVTWFLYKYECAIGLRSNQIESRPGSQRRAQVQSVWPSRPKQRRLDDPLACVRPLGNLNYFLGFPNTRPQCQLVAVVAEDDLHLFGLLCAAAAP